MARRPKQIILTDVVYGYGGWRRKSRQEAIKGPTKQQIMQEINYAIQSCKEAATKPDAYGYLPDIIESLKSMQDDLNTIPISGQTERENKAGGLGRIALDYGDFADSETGTAVLNALNHYADLVED